MPVFVVIATRSPEEVEKRIAPLPKETVFKLKGDVWLIDYEGTTRALADEIDIRGDAAKGTGIAFPVSNYSGRASAETWEWLGLHMTRGEI